MGRKPHKQYAVLAPVIDDYPDNRALRTKMASVCKRIDDRMGEALMHARIATKLAPTDPSTWRTLADVQMTAGEYAHAHKSVDMATRLAPADAANLRVKATIHAHQGSFDKALSIIQTAQRLAPHQKANDQVRTKIQNMQSGTITVRTRPIAFDKAGSTKHPQVQHNSEPAKLPIVRATTPHPQ